MTEGHRCACGWRLVLCRDCGDERCLRCDPYMAHADCLPYPKDEWMRAREEAAR